MGLAVSQLRLLSSISRKRDLELEVQMIEQHRMFMANTINNFVNLQGKLEPGSKPHKILESRIKQLQTADKLLELHLNRIQTQLQILGKIEEEARGMISQNIQATFGLLGR
jgi:hypothetical protein